MTRPEIIRADSIDLQDPNSPSAQDHSKKHANAAPLGTGPPAPHQAEALREVAAEAADEQHRSPRVSRDWSSGEAQMIHNYTNNDLAAGVTSGLAGNHSQQHDDLAAAQNGGLIGAGAEDSDMADAEGDDSMDDDMMDKISSSPSIDDEDIDFEFVYALHTFVATVEGQANATKGDTMVLLDDSNSYWWLVRVVKDSSIGYLPAEHIETPTERLARLNKHRNIDLTSAMLGDQAEKTMNPLKKAIRRRNAKTVTFSPPTYVEASDVDYSTDEEDGDDSFYGQQDQYSGQQEQHHDDEETVSIEPLKPRAEVREVRSESPDRDSSTIKSSSDTARTSDEFFDGKLEASRTRNGTLRNTDSFFKDDTVETRKITLTPNLLRDDSSTSTRTSNDSEKLKQRPSLDRLEKDLVPDKVRDKKDKKDKKEKEKKPGMLSGLFKRKDKKSKQQEDDFDDAIASKQSNENPRSSPSPSKESEDVASIEEPAHEGQKSPGKVQKQQRADMSPVRKQSISSKDPRPMDLQPSANLERAIAADAASGASLRLVQPDAQMAASPVQANNGSPVASSPKEKATGAINKILRSTESGTSDPKPIEAKQAKSRIELDDFDSTSEDSPDEEEVRFSNDQPQRPIPGSFPDSYITTPATENRNMDERLSESPVEVSPISPTHAHPPALMVDTSSQEDPPSPVSSPSPELVDVDDVKKGTESCTHSTSTTPTWSDTHLRTFFDDDADIRDLLVVVYDKSGVVPAGADHPVVGSLFREENAKLADITNRLDGMLGDWLARKMRTQSSR
ncbi:protein phosphatase regulator [Clarireedia jacksonii]